MESFVSHCEVSDSTETTPPPSPTSSPNNLFGGMFPDRGLFWVQKSILSVYRSTNDALSFHVSVSVSETCLPIPIVLSNGLSPKDTPVIPFDLPLISHPCSGLTATQTCLTPVCQMGPICVMASLWLLYGHVPIMHRFPHKIQIPNLLSQGTIHAGCIHALQCGCGICRTGFGTRPRMCQLPPLGGGGVAFVRGTSPSRTHTPIPTSLVPVLFLLSPTFSELG